MQLILATESTVDIQRDMSAIEETLNEKAVFNGNEKDLDDKKCNGNKENFAEGSTITAGQECTQIHNVEVIDNMAKKILANIEDVLLDNNYEDLKKDESCAQNADSDAVILESLDNHPNKDLIVNSSDKNDISEEVNEELMEDNIFNIEDTQNAVPEVLDSTKIDTENEIEKEFGIEERPSSVNKVGFITDKIACVSGDDTSNIGDTLELPEKDEPSNNTQACDTLTKISEELIEENNKIDVDDPKEIDEGARNEMCEIPDLNDDVKESEPIELNDEMDVDEVLVEPNKETCKAVDLDKDQVDTELIESQNDTDPAEVDKEKANDVSSLKEDVASSATVADSFDVGKSKGITEDSEIKNDISDNTQNTTVNKESQQSAPKELHDEISVDVVECVSQDIKTDTCCKLKFPNLEASIEESTIVVQDEMDVEEIKEVQAIKEPIKVTPAHTDAAGPAKHISEKPVICKLSNTLDILSDEDEEEPSRKESQVKVVEPQVKEIASTEQQSINIEDDDDIMLIDEDVPTETELNKQLETENNDKIQSPKKIDSNKVTETSEKCIKESNDLFSNINEKAPTPPAVNSTVINSSMDIDIKEKPVEKEPEKLELGKPLLPEKFLSSAKKNLADMTREDLEEFCILKIVESIVDRSSLSDIKAKLKVMTQNIEEDRKKAMMLTKQNRDLQVVLKSVQEEQKKNTNVPITPLKITRSVGMQVLMTDKLTARRKTMLAQASPIAANTPNRQNVRPTGPITRMQKPTTSNQNIPVPRLVPASPSVKSPSTAPITLPANTPTKTAPSPVPNGIKTPAQKAAEKRQHNRIQSVTVDLTDDEPPTKMSPRNSPAPPVRLVPPQNLMPPQRQPFAPAAVNSPRKVYIPISGPQSQNIRPGQTIMLKPVAGARPRCTPPQQPRPPNSVRRVTSGRHPAPLPDVMKQYQPAIWKALPPAPDLRLSKVENGIVISWKIEGYQEDSYEEIASYQLYAYQETSSPPSTSLWKKIGDVKALPLPMACTLTQFMAGFKYYFAVRAVDVKSRFGPFSLPGSILLLNKL